MDPQIYVNAPSVGQMGLYDAGVPQVIYASATNVDRIDYRLHRVSQRICCACWRGTATSFGKPISRPAAVSPGSGPCPLSPLWNATVMVSATLSAVPDGRLAPVSTSWRPVPRAPVGPPASATCCW